MTTQEKPLVSLIMATYNDSPAYLSIAIESIICQTYRNWELIIVDDSKDLDTISTIDKYTGKDERIKVVRDKKKYGFVPALNVGLENANGSYVGRMDGDDVSYPERLEMEIKYLEEHPDVDVVGTQTAIIDSNGNRTSEICFPDCGLKLRLFQMFRCPMQHGTVLMRRKLIDEGIRYDENFKRSEDLELWLRLQKKGYYLYNIQKVLYDFRIEDDYAKKRSHNHFKYNVKARRKNICWKYALTNIIGLAIASAYYLIPSGIKRIVYNRLNGR